MTLVKIVVIFIILLKFSSIFPYHCPIILLKYFFLCYFTISNKFLHKYSIKLSKIFQMNKISDAEKTYIRDGFKAKIRNDGRANNNLKDIWMQLRTLNQANGSCTVFDPDTSAKINVGIKVTK